MCTLSMRIIRNLSWVCERVFSEAHASARSSHRFKYISGTYIRGGRVLIAYFVVDFYFSVDFLVLLLLLLRLSPCSLPQSFVLSLTMAMSLGHSSSLSVSVRQEFK